MLGAKARASQDSFLRSRSTSSRCPRQDCCICSFFPPGMLFLQVIPWPSPSLSPALCAIVTFQIDLHLALLPRRKQNHHHPMPLPLIQPFLSTLHLPPLMCSNVFTEHLYERRGSVSSVLSGTPRTVLRKHLLSHGWESALYTPCYTGTVHDGHWPHLIHYDT